MSNMKIYRDLRLRDKTRSRDFQLNMTMSLKLNVDKTCKKKWINYSTL